MKKPNTNSSFFKSALCMGVSLFAVAGLWSCSDDVPAQAPEQEEATSQVVAANVVVKTDADFLSQFVTNYRTPSMARISRAAFDWEMPNIDDFTADYTIGVDKNIDWNAGGNYVVPAGTTWNPGSVALNSNKGYSNLIIYGDATIEGINMNGTAKVYVAPGGKLTLKGEYCLNTSNKSLYIYAGAEYVGSYRVQNGASIYVEGALNASGAQECGGYWYAGGEITVDGNLSTDNAHIVAPCMTVTGDWYDQNNACNIDIEYYIKVAGNTTFSCQSVVNAQCLMVGKTMELTNAVTLNIASYINANTVNINASRWHINMGGDALLDCGEKLYIKQNGGVNIAFDNDANTTSVIKAKEIQGNVQNFNNVPSLDFMCISGYVDLQYEKRNENCEQIRAQQTLTENGGVSIKADEDGCKPASPGHGGGDNPPLPPVITEVISHIDGDHTHDTSATCIALYNGKAYISWHKRGTSIHGCIEALSVANDQATLTSWMETETGSTQGGDNWEGNSAVQGADSIGEVQGEYDFNHVIVVNDGGVNYAVTVGDNAVKGGFIGAIALDANGDFGTSAAATEGFIARQLLTKKGKMGRSGNAVVRTDDGKYLIACAGGFQEYDGPIADLGVKVTYPNSGSSYWKANLGEYSLTSGSAKHIALDPNGNYVATLEFTDRSGNVDENNYWFNDNTTVLPATIKVRNIDGWLKKTVWETEIEGGICPIYGKNVITMDATGNVYVSEGVTGLGVYKNRSKIGSFNIAGYDEKMARKYSDAAVNGLAIDDNYIYLAYGAAGLWILDKNTLEVVSYYTKGGASANYVAVDSSTGYIYLAYGRAGVNVLKLNK